MSEDEEYKKAMRDVIDYYDRQKKADAIAMKIDRVSRCDSVLVADFIKVILEVLK